MLFPRLEPNGTGELEGIAFSLDDGGSLNLTRQGNTAVLHRPGYEDRMMPLVDRRLGEELAEELRRLDADQPYAAALSAAYGLHGLADRPRNRVHIWQDPAYAESPERASAPQTVTAGTMSGPTS